MIHQYDLIVTKFVSTSCSLLRATVYWSYFILVLCRLITSCLGGLGIGAMHFACFTGLYFIFSPSLTKRTSFIIEFINSYDLDSLIGFATQFFLCFGQITLKRFSHFFSPFCITACFLCTFEL